MKPQPFRENSRRKPRGYCCRDFVTAILPESKEVTFKQYVYDAGKHYLKPLNPQYPTIQIDDRIQLHGVLSWCITPQTLETLNNLNRER